MAEAQAAPTAGRSYVALVSLITAVVGLGPLSVSFYIPSMPAIAQALGAAPSAVQATLTFYLLGFAVAQLVIGPLSDRFGRMPVLLAGMTTYLVASVGCALAPTVEVLWFARLVQGIAACTGPVVGRAIVRDLFEGTVAIRVFSFIGTAIALAPAIGPIIGGAIQEWLGWQANFLALALIALVLILLVRRRLTESNGELKLDALRPRRLVSIYRDLIVNRRYMGNVVPGTCAFAGLMTYTASAPFLFIHEVGLSPGEFGLITIFHVSGYALGAFLAGRLAAHVAPFRIILAGFVLLVTGGLVMTVLAGEVSVFRIIGPFVIYTIGFGLLLPPSIAAALQPFPRVAGSASALLGFMQFGASAGTSIWAAGIYAGTAAPIGWFQFSLGAAGLILFVLLRPWREAPE